MHFKLIRRHFKFNKNSEKTLEINKIQTEA